MRLQQCHTKLQTLRIKTILAFVMSGVLSFHPARKQTVASEHKDADMIGRLAYHGVAAMRFRPEYKYAGHCGDEAMAAHVTEVLRGGWGGPKPGYTLSYQTAASNGSQIEQVPFSGLDDELTAFIDQVLAHVCGLFGFHRNS